MWEFFLSLRYVHISDWTYKKNCNLMPIAKLRVYISQDQPKNTNY